ncbi:aminotransferase class i and ii [Moniliophthora roreri]|nr:aminotransferase class i and ii [Moniliophthora roreri]
MVLSGFGSGPCVSSRIPDIPDAHSGFGVDADHDHDDAKPRAVLSTMSPPMALTTLGITPVPLEIACDNSFIPPRTEAIALVAPNNPGSQNLDLE